MIRRLRWAGIYALCAAVVVFVRVGLWVTRYQRLHGFLVRPTAPDPQPTRRQTVLRIVYAVSRMARLVPDASCLTQCITAQAVLSWKDIPTRIHVGAKKTDTGTVLWHAWLVWNDTVVMEGDEGSLADFRKLHDLSTPSRIAQPQS